MPHAQDSPQDPHVALELNRRIFEAIPGGVVYVARDGSITHANPEACRVLGLRYDELTEKYVQDFATETFHEDGSVCPVEHYPVTRALATGEPQPPHTIGVRRPGGETSWAVFRAIPVVDVDGGEARGAVVTFLDITDRRSAEEARRESEARYRELVEGSPEPIATVQDRRLAFINAAGAALLGAQQSEDLVGLAVSEIMPAEGVERAAEYAERRRNGEILPALESRLTRLDGTSVDVEFSAVPCTYGGRQATLFVARDVSERKRAEEQLRALEEQMRHAQKLESLGLLAGGIAHDFNNLLAAILGNASLAKLKLQPESDAVEALAALEAAAMRAADLTRQMLAYSGKSHVEARALDLSTVVRELAELLSTIVSKKAVLKIKLPKGLPAIEGDPAQLQQVVMNLIINASDALGDQPGTIVLRTGRRPMTRTDLGTTYVDDDLPAGDYVFLEVTDTGKGMDPTTRARVFDPFFTTKSTGRGLGLAATLGIVRGHRGAVELESLPGVGTTFRVFFPASAEDGAAVAPAARPPQAVNGSATVLVVDDEAVVRDVTKKLLEELGYQVVTADGGRNAISEFTARGERIDVVLLDMTMNDMSGGDVMEQLCAIRPDARIVLCSGYTEEDVAEHLGRAVSTRFLQKPYTVGALVEAIESARAR